MSRVNSDLKELEEYLDNGDDYPVVVADMEVDEEYNDDPTFPRVTVKFKRGKKKFSSTKSFAVNISTWSNKPVAQFLERVIKPKDPNTRIYKLKQEQIDEIEKTLGKKPKVGSFKEIYQQYKDVDMTKRKPGESPSNISELVHNREQKIEDLAKKGGPEWINLLKREVRKVLGSVLRQFGASIVKWDDETVAVKCNAERAYDGYDNIQGSINEALKDSKYEIWGRRYKGEDVYIIVGLA